MSAHAYTSQASASDKAATRSRKSRRSASFLKIVVRSMPLAIT